MKLITIKAKDMVEDFDIYPRGGVDSGHVSHIAEALEAGVKMPPPVVQAKTLRIVDGFHRSRAWRRVYGNDAEIQVEERTYSTEAEVWADAASLNINHGRALTTYDRMHAISRATALGIKPALIASALNMTTARLKELSTSRLCSVKNSSRQVPIKISMRNMAGRTLTKEQSDIIPKLGGNQQLFYVNQLLMLIDSKMLDLDNVHLIEGLRDLNTKISTILKPLK